MSFGAIEASPASGNQDEEYVELVNCDATAVDVSGWRIGGGVTLALPPGTVIPAGGSVWLSPSLPAFRARTTGPRGGQGLLVAGPYSGRLAPAERLELFDENGRRVSAVGGIAYQLTTAGNGDMQLAVDKAVPGAHLFPLFSAVTTHRLGCGPLLGLGGDALWSVGVPAGTAPFHVLADAGGRYRFAAPNGTLPKGLQLDSRVLELALPAVRVRLSRIVRVQF